MLGAILGAAGSIAGSLFGKSSADKANKAQAKMAAQNIAMQKEFAQHGVRWKVEDAKRAGLHPLAALGMQPVSFNPVSIGTATSDFGGFGQAGQDIGRAIDSTRTHGERNTANTVLGKLAVERAGLENDLLRSQIAKNTQAATPPARPVAFDHPVAGQGDSAKLIEVKPMEQTPTLAGASHHEPGANPSIGYVDIGGGYYAPVKSKAASERLEDDTIGNVEWSVMNRMLPTFGLNQSPPPRTQDMIDNDEYWSYHPFRRGYGKVRRRAPGVYW